MKMVFNFKMSVDDYRKMLFCRTFGNSWLRRGVLFSTWAVFTLPSAIITMEINVIKYKEAYLAGFSAERQIIADDGGLTFWNKTTNETGKNTWKEVTRLEELKNVFVIQLNRREAVILPKRGMGTQKRVEQFRELANQQIPDQFYALKRSRFS